MRLLSAFAAGALFALGLAISGMTQPEKVLGFLDVTGAWDASLAFVMAGAIGVHFTARRLLASRKAPLFAPEFATPTGARIDAPLVVGAALFGAGWGLSGYCPGPAVASAVVAGRPALVFLAAMIVGMGLSEMVRRAKTSAPSAGPVEEVANALSPTGSRDAS